LASGEEQMKGDIHLSLRSIHTRDLSDDINTLTDSRAGLLVEFVPQLALAGENQSRRITRIHFVIKGYSSAGAQHRTMGGNGIQEVEAAFSGYAGEGADFAIVQQPLPRSKTPGDFFPYS
jgi:hypothetical protein